MLAVLLVAGTAGPLVAKPRVETGRDLYVACRQAVADADQGRTPQDSTAIYHCNHFLAGLFRSHQVMTRNRVTAKEHANDDPMRLQCLRVPQVATFKQLARQVVNHAEWHPDLMDEPAMELAFSAFDAMDPC